MEMDTLINIIVESFDENITTSCSETVLGLESYLDGKEDFIKELRLKLKEIGIYTESDLRLAFKNGQNFETRISDLDEDKYIDSIKIKPIE